MVEGRGVDCCWGAGGEGFLVAKGLNQVEKRTPIKGELGAAAGVCCYGVWEGGQLCAGEVVAVHGDEGGD